MDADDAVGSSSPQKKRQKVPEEVIVFDEDEGDNATLSLSRKRIQYLEVGFLDRPG